MENDKELLPCKCGSTYVECCTMRGIPSVRCHGCGNWLLKYNGTMAEVIKEWNDINTLPAPKA